MLSFGKELKWPKNGDRNLLISKRGEMFLDKKKILISGIVFFPLNVFKKSFFFKSVKVVYCLVKC